MDFVLPFDTGADIVKANEFENHFQVDEMNMQWNVEKMYTFLIEGSKLDIRR